MKSQSDLNNPTGGNGTAKPALRWLDNIGGEPLAGFENEEPDPEFRDADEEG